MDYLSLFARIGGISAIVGYFSRRKAKKRKQIEEQKKISKLQEMRMEHVEKALLGIEHHEIYQTCNHYIQRGYVYSDDLNDLDYLYNPYHEYFKGNGTGEFLYNEVHKLPLKVKEEN